MSSNTVSISGTKSQKLLLRQHKRTCLKSMLSQDLKTLFTTPVNLYRSPSRIQYQRRQLFLLYLGLQHRQAVPSSLQQQLQNCDTSESKRRQASPKDTPENQRYHSSFLLMAPKYHSNVKVLLLLHFLRFFFVSLLPDSLTTCTWQSPILNIGLSLLLNYSI